MIQCQEQKAGSTKACFVLGPRLLFQHTLTLAWLIKHIQDFGPHQHGWFTAVTFMLSSCQSFGSQSCSRPHGIAAAVVVSHKQRALLSCSAVWQGSGERFLLMSKANVLPDLKMVLKQPTWPQSFNLVPQEASPSPFPPAPSHQSQGYQLIT